MFLWGFRPSHKYNSSSNWSGVTRKVSLNNSVSLRSCGMSRKYLPFKRCNTVLHASVSASLLFYADAETNLAPDLTERYHRRYNRRHYLPSSNLLIKLEWFKQNQLTGFLRGQFFELKRAPGMCLVNWEFSCLSRDGKGKVFTACSWDFSRYVSRRVNFEVRCCLYSKLCYNCTKLFLL